MEVKKFYPLNDRVLIKPLESGERRSGAILMMSSENDTKFGKVIAVGPGRTSEFGTFINVNVKVGDIVIIPKIGAQRVEIEGEEYWTIADRELVATVDIEEN